MKTFTIAINRPAGDAICTIHADNLHIAIATACEMVKAPIEAVKYWHMVPTARQLAKTKSLMRSL